mmetsp:Transcript_2676/g.6788  ORF Transcript_2676/g.6788 Transcript_2676/m.6788 type:complete len:240 (-) Transcript_2676:1070-1789(-)
MDQPHTVQREVTHPAPSPRVRLCWRVVHQPVHPGGRVHGVRRVHTQRHPGQVRHHGAAPAAGARAQRLKGPAGGGDVAGAILLAGPSRPGVLQRHRAHGGLRGGGVARGGRGRAQQRRRPGAQPQHQLCVQGLRQAAVPGRHAHHLPVRGRVGGHKPPGLGGCVRQPVRVWGRALPVTTAARHSAPGGSAWRLGQRRARPERAHRCGRGCGRGRGGAGAGRDCAGHVGSEEAQAEARAG